MNKTNGPIRVVTDILDSQTGEILTSSNILNKDKNFTKVWVSNYIDVVKEDSLKKDLIPFQLIDIMDKHNKLKFTLVDMSKKLNYPKSKLSVLLKELRGKDFLRRIRNGLYMINPNIAYKSTSENRTIALKEYYGLSESKELIAQKERQKKIKNTKSKLKKLTSEELLKIATSQNLDDTIFTELAERLVDGGEEIK